MATTRLIESEHFFYYSAKKPVTAAMLADSLLGLDGVVNHGARMLSTMFEARIKSGGILIKKIEFGSYKDDFVVRFFLGKGKTLEKNIEKLRAKLGLQKMDNKTIIKWVIIVTIGLGIWYFARQRGDQAATISITNSFNNWGKEVGMTGPELIKAMDGMVKNKEDLKKQVNRLARPKGSDDNGKIVLDNDENFSIDAVAVAAVPLQVEAEVPEEPAKDFEKTVIVIRAADLDRQQGWYGIAPEISDARVSIHIEDGVDRDKILLGKYNEVAMTVLYRVDKAGEKHPRIYLIRKIFPVPPI